MNERIAEALLKIGAVFLRPNEPFIWASGIKSPIYCDNRLILSCPDERTLVETALSDLVEEHFAGCEALFGTSTAGIAHAAITAEMLGLPMGYVRGGAKDHGRGNRIEGRLSASQKVVVIEDLISTAGSAVETAETLREAGADVMGIASIFTYNMERGKKRLASANLTNNSLTNLDVVARVAARSGYITDADVSRLLKFRDNPADESWIGGTH